MRIKRYLIALLFLFTIHVSLFTVSNAHAGLTLTDVGADAVLAKYFNGTVPAGGNNLVLKLYCTNVNPVDTHTVSNYTECAGGGYAAKTLTAGSWTLTTGNDPSDVVYAAQTFTFTGVLTTNGTIYGYYVVNQDNVLVWADVVSPTFTPGNNGDNVVITPKFQMSKGTPN